MEGDNEKVRNQTEGSGQHQRIGEHEPGGDEQARPASSQSDQQRSGEQGGQPSGSDVSGGTLGSGHSGGFGNQTSATPQGGQGSTGNEFGQKRGESAFGQQGQSAGGQSDLGSQSATTLAGRADQQDLGQDQPGSSPTAGLQGTSGASEGEGFIGAQGSGSDDYLQQQESDEGQDFAREGRGAPESRSENIETGQRENRDSDIEGGSGNA